MKLRISIVIPARNDAKALRLTLDHLERLQAIETAEIIVAAWGDTKETEEAVAGRASILWPLRPTRAALMNAGAAAAMGDIFFFLHADSLPPLNALKEIQTVLRDAAVLGGAFAHRFAETEWSLRFISWINRWRYFLTRNYYGDQGIFVRAGIFRAMGGYRDLFMEDLDFSQRLKKLGRTKVISVPLITSGRRFLTWGPWRALSFILWVLFLHSLRLNTQPYADHWDRWGGRSLNRRNLRRSDPAVLLTGATGFIGRHVVARLLLAGRRVVILARPCSGLTGEQRVAEIFGDASRQSLNVVEADLADPAVIESKIRRHGSTIDTVIHCAGETTFSAGERESARTVQIDGPLALLKILSPAGLRRWIHVSTAFVCGCREGVIYENETDLGQEFHNGYERLKLELEIRLRQECRQLGVDLRICRPSIVVGGAPSTPGGVPSNLFLALLRLLVALSCKAGARNTLVRIHGRPQARFNIVPVEYVAVGIERLADDPEGSGETIHLVAKNPPTQKRMLSMMSAHLDLRNLHLVDATEDLSERSPLETRVARMLLPYREYLEQDVQFDDSAALQLLGRHGIEPPEIDERELERFFKLACFSEKNDAWARTRGYSRQVIPTVGHERRF